MQKRWTIKPGIVTIAYTYDSIVSRKFHLNCRPFILPRDALSTFLF
jgi:hypothetical protein